MAESLRVTSPSILEAFTESDLNEIQTAITTTDGKQNENATSNKYNSADLTIGDVVLMSSIADGIGVVRHIDGISSIIGIELTDPIGDNDGICDDHRYFKCRPNYGIFVAVNDIVRVIAPEELLHKIIVLNRALAHKDNDHHKENREYIDNIQELTIQNDKLQEINKQHQMMLNSIQMGLTQNIQINDDLSTENVSLKEEINDYQENEMKFQSEIQRLNEEQKEIELKYNSLQIQYNEAKRERMNTKNYLNWDYNDVLYWMTHLENERFSKYKNKLSKALKEENIDGTCLNAMEKSDLHRFGITDFKDKNSLISHIHSLNVNNNNNNNNNNKPMIISNIMHNGDVSVQSEGQNNTEYI